MIRHFFHFVTAIGHEVQANVNEADTMTGSDAIDMAAAQAENADEGGKLDES